MKSSSELTKRDPKQYTAYIARLFRWGALAQSLDHLKQGVKDYPDDPKMWSLFGEYHYRMGNLKDNARDIAGAVQCFSEAILCFESALNLCRKLEQSPESKIDVQMVGRSYARLEKFDKAVAFLETALLRHKDDAGLIDNMVDYCCKMKDFEKAAIYAEKLARFNFEDLTKIFRFVSICLYLKRHTELIDFLLEVDTHCPNQPEILSCLGQNYFTLKKFSKAIHYLERAINLRTRAKTPAKKSKDDSTLAAAWCEVGCFEQAGDVLVNRLNDDPKDGKIREQLRQLVDRNSQIKQYAIR